MKLFIVLAAECVSVPAEGGVPDSGHCAASTNSQQRGTVFVSFTQTSAVNSPCLNISRRQTFSALTSRPVAPAAVNGQLCGERRVALLTPPFLAFCQTCPFGLLRNFPPSASALSANDGWPAFKGRHAGFFMTTHKRPSMFLLL